MENIVFVRSLRKSLLPVHVPGIMESREVYGNEVKALVEWMQNWVKNNNQAMQ